MGLDLSKMGLNTRATTLEGQIVFKATKTFSHDEIVAFGAVQDADDKATGITIPAGSLVLSAEITASGDVANQAKMDDLKFGDVDVVGAADEVNLETASTAVISILRQLSGAVTCSFAAGENFAQAADETVDVTIFYVAPKAV